MRQTIQFLKQANAKTWLALATALILAVSVIYAATFASPIFTQVCGMVAAGGLLNLLIIWTVWTIDVAIKRFRVSQDRWFAVELVRKRALKKVDKIAAWKHSHSSFEKCPDER